ncbi:MAG TPA: hypothetical protein VFI31_26175 [Pirellulales bacterium]|nr:hypothetical protein [Pirellulales bacterium]
MSPLPGGSERRILVFADLWRTHDAPYQKPAQAELKMGHEGSLTRQGGGCTLAPVVAQNCVGGEMPFHASVAAKMIDFALGRNHDMRHERA